MMHPLNSEGLRTVKRYSPTKPKIRHFTIIDKGIIIVPKDTISDLGVNCNNILDHKQHSDQFNTGSYKTENASSL